MVNVEVIFVPNHIWQGPANGRSEGQSARKCNVSTHMISSNLHTVLSGAYFTGKISLHTILLLLRKSDSCHMWKYLELKTSSWAQYYYLEMLPPCGILVTGSDTWKISFICILRNTLLLSCIFNLKTVTFILSHSVINAFVLWLGF